jgi:hypothetical protein
VRNLGASPNRRVIEQHFRRVCITSTVEHTTQHNTKDIVFHSYNAYQASLLNDILNLCRDGNFDLNPGLDVDNDLLHDFRRSIETIAVSISIATKACRILNQALVDPHLEEIPRLRTFTTRRLPRADSQVLGGQAHWALHTEVLVLGAIDQLGTDFLCSIISIWRRATTGRPTNRLHVTLKTDSEVSYIERD